MRILNLTPVIFLGCAVLLAEDTQKANERLDDAAALFSDVMAIPERSIPQGLLDKSQCIVVVPGLKKGAFVFGGKYGRGFVVCRGANGQGWGAPAAIRIEGGSFGLQIGFSSSDVILLVMNERGMRAITKDKFTIGGEATATAGPVGRDATAQTDVMASAEILSWSRSKGLFGGVSLDGATLRSDKDENKLIYGKTWSTKEVLESGVQPPAASQKLIGVLNKQSSRKSI